MAIIGGTLVYLKLEQLVVDWVHSLGYRVQSDDLCSLLSYLVLAIMTVILVDVPLCVSVLAFCSSCSLVVGFSSIFMKPYCRLTTLNKFSNRFELDALHQRAVL